MFLYFLEFKLLRVILWRLWTFPWPLNVVGSHSPAGVVTADLIFPFNKGSPSRGVQPCCPRDTFLICLLNQLACCCCCGSAVSDSVTPRTAVCQASLSFPISWSLHKLKLKLMSILSVMSSNYLILCRPLLLPPSIFPRIRVFSVCQFFASGGQSIGVSDSSSVFSMTSYGIVVFLKKNNQHWSISVKYISLLLLICLYS